MFTCSFSNMKLVSISISRFGCRKSKIIGIGPAFECAPWWSFIYHSTSSTNSQCLHASIQRVQSRPFTAPYVFNRNIEWQFSRRPHHNPHIMTQPFVCQSFIFVTIQPNHISILSVTMSRFAKAAFPISNRIVYMRKILNKQCGCDWFFVLSTSTFSFVTWNRNSHLTEE